MTACLMLLIAILTGGCAIFAPHAKCGGEFDTESLGVSRRDGRVWTVSAEGDDLEKLVVRAGKCFAKRNEPIALVDDRTGKFMGTVRHHSKSILTDRQYRNVFDDHLGSRGAHRFSGTCKPSDFEDVKESAGVLSIDGRRVTSTADPHDETNMKYWSVWLTRCLPNKGGILWLTPDGAPTAVYIGRLYSTF